MIRILTSVNSLRFDFGSYAPLIIVCGALAAIFVVFKLVGISSKLVWKLLINALIGALMLCLFDILFVNYLNMDFFYIPITWPNVLIAGILGIPGVLLLLILGFIL